MFDDVLWGNVVHVVDGEVVEVRITYQPTLNRGSYQSRERVRLMGEVQENGGITDAISNYLDVSAGVREAVDVSELLGRNLLLRVLDREQECLCCEVSLMI